MSITVEFNRCALCGGELPRLDPWHPGRSVFCESCTVLAQRESALHGACLAMSRFLVWVWCEALASWQEELFRCGFDSRCSAYASACMRGFLRADWSRP